MASDRIYAIIGATIRNRRRVLRVTQENLAPRLGISRASLANIETGRQAILVHQLYRLAEVLEMSPTDLLPPPSQQPAANADRPEPLPLPEDLKPSQRQQIARLLK